MMGKSDSSSSSSDSNDVISFSSTDVDDRISLISQSLTSNRWKISFIDGGPFESIIHLIQILQKKFVDAELYVLHAASDPMEYNTVLMKLPYFIPLSYIENEFKNELMFLYIMID